MSSKIIAEKISEARYQLWLFYPLFGYLALSLKFQEHPDGGPGGVGTAGIDPEGNLYYKPEFIDSLNLVDTAVVITHEILHLVQCATARFPKGGNRMVWNLAADVVVNSIILESGFNLESSDIIDKMISKENFIKYKGMPTEEIYRRMMQENEADAKGQCPACQKNNEQGAGEQGQSGGDEPPQGDEQGAGEHKKDCEHHPDNWLGCSASTHQHKNQSARSSIEWSRKLVEAHEFSKGRTSNSKGNISGRLMDYIVSLSKPTVTWRDHLRRATSVSFKTRYTWNKPGRRSEAIGMRLQAKKPAPKGVVVCIDTSGSIPLEIITQFLTESLALMRASKAAFIHIFFHDVECYSHGRYTPNTINKIKIQKGGTSHIPVFEAIKESKEKVGMVVCFTDLMSSFPEEAWVKRHIGAPVIWAVPSAYSNYDIPFGKKIVVQI